MNPAVVSYFFKVAELQLPRKKVAWLELQLRILQSNQLHLLSMAKIFDAKCSDLFSM